MSASSQHVGRVPSHGAAPTGRKKLAQGKELRGRAQAPALGHESQNTSSPEGAKEGGLVALGEMSESRVAQDGPPSRGEFTYVDISSIDRETKRVVDPKCLPVAKAPSRAKQVLKAGDVLVSMTRPNLNAVALVPPDLDGVIGSTGFHVLRAKDAEPGFLFYAVQTTSFIDAMCLKVQGALYPAVRPKDISSFCIHPFSLAQQRRIVAEIEKQFTRLEAGVAALRRVQANLKRYRAAVLKAACEGKLVPTEAELAAKKADSHPGGVQDISRGLSASDTPGNVSPKITHPEGVAERDAGSGIPSGCGDSLNDVPGVSSRPALLNPRLISGSPPGFTETGFESGEQLLKRILAERRQHWLARRSLGEGGTGRGQYKEPAAPDIANLSPLPAGWTWASVDQLSSHITSGSRDWSQFYGKGNGTFILAQNVRPMRLDLSERQSVAAPEGDAETERTRVRAADLLVTIVGAKTGDVCRVPSELKDHFVCQSVALLRPVVAAFAKFAELYLASQENGQAQWKRYIYGQGRPHLSFEQLRVTAIALPPLAEQTRIVAEVERRLSVMEELESVVSANLQRATRLRQSILQKAFTGGLV